MIVCTAVSRDPLDVAAHLAAVGHAAAGAIALFVGTVRDHDPEAGGRVVRLEYRDHPESARILARIAGGLDGEGLRIAVSHRAGMLDVGDAAIVCAVSSAHRADAFEVCRGLVERVKAELPIWKRQIEDDGSARWVGLGGHAP